MKDGGPAFPHDNRIAQPGMSLRDWFAGLALQGMIACPGTSQGCTPETFRVAAARNAYLYADEMIAAREKK